MSTGDRSGAPGSEQSRTRAGAQRGFRLFLRFSGFFVFFAVVLALLPLDRASFAAPPDPSGPQDGSGAGREGEALLARPAVALRAALAAQEDGDLPRAEWLLAQTSLRHPLISDHADLARAEVLRALSRPADAADVAQRALDLHPDSLLRDALLSVRGHALADRGDEEGARAVWRVALDTSGDPGLRAALLFATAASQERSGQSGGASETYRVIWHLYPLSAEAQRAGAWLDRMEAVNSKSLRAAEDWRRRADSFFRARRNEEALEAYDEALARGLSASQAGRAHNLRAQVLFRMRRYPEAVDAFDALPQKDDVPIWHARSLARAGRVPESIVEFEEIARRRRGSHAQRARFLAALLLEGRGETERARAYFESLSQDRAGSAVRLASLWRLGFGAYLEGRHADAIAAIDRLIVGEQDPIEGLRSRYWRARALEGLARAPDTGDAHAAASARAEFEGIALTYPFTYYGWRARERLPAAVRSGASPPLPPAPALRPGTRKLSVASLERVRILLEAGLPARARDELARLARQVGGLEDRLALAQLMRDAGSFSAAQQLVLDTYPETLARGPKPTLEELWWHAWPAAYLDLVEAAAPTGAGVDAALVFSIMREESGFRAQVVSPVGARGLLQIMEPTGRRLARAVGRPDFHVDDLFDPQVNIELGSHYLGELLAQFDGRLSPAIASYNAGPEAVGRWLDENGHLEEDEWVEAIPYDETRNYVKRVLRSLQAYRLLY